CAPSSSHGSIPLAPTVRGARRAATRGAAHSSSSHHDCKKSPPGNQVSHSALVRTRELPGSSAPFRSASKSTRPLSPLDSLERTRRKYTYPCSEWSAQNRSPVVSRSATWTSTDVFGVEERRFVSEPVATSSS